MAQSLLNANLERFVYKIWDEDEVIDVFLLLMAHFIEFPDADVSDDFVQDQLSNTDNEFPLDGAIEELFVYFDDTLRGVVRDLLEVFTHPYLYGVDDLIEFVREMKDIIFDLENSLENAMEHGDAELIQLLGANISDALGILNVFDTARSAERDVQDEIDESEWKPYLDSFSNSSVN